MLLGDSRQRSQKGMLKPFLVPSLSIVSTITKGMRRSKVSFEISSRPLPSENVFQVKKETPLTLHYQLQGRARGETKRERLQTRTKVLLPFWKLVVSGGHVTQKLLYWTKVTRSIYNTIVTSKTVLHFV